MGKLRIGIIELVTNAPTKQWYARAMNANLSGIMPQVVATWCEQLGHDVTFVCYTGFDGLFEKVEQEFDLVFVTAFTRSAQLAYAISNKARSLGAVTVLGGPHSLCYPEDAQKYFDYVVGYCDKELISDILADCSQHRPLGQYLSRETQPTELPGVQERWKFQEQVLEGAPWLKIVPMIGSLGCPYTCSFCIDADVAYQQLDFETIQSDLRFLLTKYKRPIVGWHDPNFGVRFKDYMDAIEEAIPKNSIDFISETSLSLVSEKKAIRLKENGFAALLPGVESWYDMGNKSKSGSKKGAEKVQQISEQVNMILRHIPYIQTNFVLGLDCDEGPEPFELTKEFLDKSPGAFPTFPLLSAFGKAAPLNLEAQRSGRVLPFPFHLLNNNHAMNVKPSNYSWHDFYSRVVDVSRHAYSWKAIWRRWQGNSAMKPGIMNLLRAVSSEGFGRIKYYSEVLRQIETNPQVQAYLNQETTVLPDFFMDRIKKDLGPFWDWLPEGSLDHDHLAYSKSVDAGEQKEVSMVAGVSAASAA